MEVGGELSPKVTSASSRNIINEARGREAVEGLEGSHCSHCADCVI